MLRQCVTCGIESNNKKDYFELSAKVGPRYICRECAAELGIKNFMSAGFNSNTGVLKKYVKIHPEAQPRLEAQLERVAKYNADFKRRHGRSIKAFRMQKAETDKVRMCFVQPCFLLW